MRTYYTCICDIHTRTHTRAPRTCMHAQHASTGAPTACRVEPLHGRRELQGGEDSGAAGPSGRSRDGLGLRGHHYGRDRDPIGPQPPSKGGVGSGPPKEDDGHDSCTLCVGFGAGPARGCSCRLGGRPGAGIGSVNVCAASWGGGRPRLPSMQRRGGGVQAGWGRIGGVEGRRGSAEAVSNGTLRAQTQLRGHCSGQSSMLCVSCDCVLQSHNHITHTT